MTRLETPRLIIRETTPEDAGDYFGFINRDEYLRFMPFGRSTEEEIREALADETAKNADEARTSWRLSFMPKDTGKVIGDVKVTQDAYRFGGIANVGYGVNPDYWNQNYLTEALRVVTAWAHETLKFHRLQATCALDNIGSWRALEKSGYEREGITRYASYNSREGVWDEADYVYASVRPELAVKQ